MRRPILALSIVAALALAISPAHAEAPEFHIGVVASVTGPFAAPTKDTFDGFNAWMKQHSLPGKKIVLQRLDDETAVLNATGSQRVGPWQAAARLNESDLQQVADLVISSHRA